MSELANYSNIVRGGARATTTTRATRSGGSTTTSSSSNTTQRGGGGTTTTTRRPPTGTSAVKVTLPPAKPAPTTNTQRDVPLTLPNVVVSPTLPIPVVPVIAAPAPNYGGGGGGGSNGGGGGGGSNDGGGGNDGGGNQGDGIESSEEIIYEDEPEIEEEESIGELPNSSEFSNLDNGQYSYIAVTEDEIKAGTEVAKGIGSVFSSHKAAKAQETALTGCRKPSLPKFLARKKWNNYEDCLQNYANHKTDANKPPPPPPPPSNNKGSKVKPFFSTPAGIVTIVAIGVAGVLGSVYIYKKFIK